MHCRECKCYLLPSIDLLDKIDESVIDFDNIYKIIKENTNMYTDIHNIEVLKIIQKQCPYVLFIGTTDIYTTNIYVHLDNEQQVNSIIIYDFEL